MATAPSPVRIGLIGAGGIAGAHARGYRALAAEGLCRVTAVADALPEAAARRAGELEAAHTFSDYHDLLALSGPDSPDAVDICLPHDLHTEVALAACASGKHVLVEKPIATTLQDARAMILAARAAGVVLQVGHNERFDPQYQEMKRLVDTGALGEVFAARADHNQDLRLPEGHWLRSAQRSGGGVVIGSGIHRLDLLRWFLGDVAEVHQVQVTRPERLEPEAAAFTTLRLHSGAIAELSSNWAVRRFPWYEMMWLYGSHGSVHNIGGVHLDDGHGDVRRLSVPERDSFTEEIRHFLTCVTTGATPLVNGEEGLRALALCLAGYRSAAEGRPVTPDA